MTRKQKRGRRPAGRDETGKAVPVSTAYSQTTLRLSPSYKAGLEIAASLIGRGMSEVVQRALDLYFDSLPRDEQEMIEQFRTRALQRRSHRP